MPTNTVIITAFDGALRAMTDLFVKHLRSGEGTEELMEHILVLNFDKETLDFCQKHKPLRCYFDTGVSSLVLLHAHSRNQSGNRKDGLVSNGIYIQSDREKIPYFTCILAKMVLVPNVTAGPCVE